MKLARTAAAIFCSLIIAVPAYASYPPDQVITMKGNYVITGDLYVDNLLGHVGECLEVGMQGQLIPTGAVCGGGGGGGVTSVTSVDSEGNLVAAPTTGAVILDFAVSPLFQTVTSTNVHVHGQLENSVYLGHSGECLEVGGSNAIVPTGSACGAGVGVTSVTNTDGNLTIAPTTGAVVANLANSVSVFNNLTVGSGGGTTTLETNTTNTGGLTVDGLINGAGDITFAGAGANLPVCTNGVSHLTTSGCTSGGVTSVTSANALINATPTVGAVVLTGNESPTFTGPATFNSSITGNSTLFVSGLATVGNLTDTALTINSPVCTNGSSNLTSCGGGFPAVQQLHGNQSITAVAAACTAGTPIVFTHTFSTAPDIVGSTGPVVGDTFAPLSITTTGFTPEVCSVASNAAVTVYWNAVN